MKIHIEENETTKLIAAAKARVLDHGCGEGNVKDCLCDLCKFVPALLKVLDSIDMAVDMSAYGTYDRESMQTIREVFGKLNR